MNSVLHTIATDLLQHEVKREIEERLHSSEPEFTILYPKSYLLPHWLIPAFDHGVFRLSWSLDCLQSLVSLGDITDVAAAVLADA